MRKIFIISIFLFFALTSLKSSQIILEQIDIIKNYKIEKETFDYTIGNFYLNNFKKLTILVEKDKDFETTIKGLFNNIPVEILSEAVVSNFTLKDDKIVAKKILILDREYKIVNIDNKEFYKFILYIKKEKEKPSFLQNLINQFKIEYGYKDN